MARPALAFGLALAVLAAGPAGCGARQEPSDPDRPLVVATINIIADLARQVAGDRVEVRSLLAAGADPHTYEPVPADVRLIARSDLVLYNGFNLEKWLEKLIANAGGTRPRVAVAEGLAAIGDGRGDPDPHLWMDPVQARGYVVNIRDALIRLDPEGAGAYRENARRYLEALEALDRWIREQVATIPPERRKLVTTHDAFRYFGRRYGFHVVGTIWGISTEDEPSAREMAALVDAVRREGVPAVFVETTINPRLMQRIAEDAGVRIGRPLYGDSLGPPGSGAETYLDMMRFNVMALVEGLR